MDDDSKEKSEEIAPILGNGAETEPPITTRHCSKCATQVVPNAKGQCPVCGTFTTGNQVARKHIANVARREQYLAENLAEYRPDTLQLRDACRLLANVRERLDTIREGTPEHQRLIAAWTELTATLEASRASRAPHEATDVDNLTPDQLVAKAEKVLETARLVARASKPESALGPGSGAPDRETEAVGSPESDVLDPARSTPFGESGPLSEATVETCPYCHQSPCVGRSHHAYDVLHAEDPEHIEARRQKATAEMYESIRRQRTGDPNVR